MQQTNSSTKYPIHHAKVPGLCFVLALLLTLYSTKGSSQCTTTGVQVIPDGDMTSIQFIVSGLLDNDLSSPTQGICGIQLDFMHEYIGDLTITLISPSGTSDTLVGPLTTAIMNTNLTRWNIQFIPCMSAALPDAGFSPVWNNLQAWQAFTPYTGSYHPHSGCLEDFNTGPANGVWQIKVEDHDVLQIGTVASATLIFCNPAGLQCAECSPNSGVLSPLSITRCIGQNISSSDIIRDFEGAPPLPSLYSYQYLMTLGNTIIRSGSFFSDTPAPGDYSICGLSYLTTDSMLVNNLLSAGDYDALIQAIGTGSICAEISSPCVALNVLPIPDTTIFDVFLCPKETFIFKGQIYSTSGTYYVLEDAIGLCDSVFRLNISTSDLFSIINEPDSISCGGPAVVLNGNGSHGGVGLISYHWSTDAGIITGNPNSSTVTTTVPGLYMLTVRDGACEATAEVVVHGDVSYPKIFVQDGEITCLQTSYTIRPIVIPTNVTYSWSGPGGFASTLKDIIVTNPGRYFLQISSASGCLAFTYVDVIDHTEPPDASMSIIDKLCEHNFAVLSAATTSGTYEWSGPGGPFPQNQNIHISLPGNYSITVTDSYTGCTATDNFVFDGDFLDPTIILSGLDSIRCNQNVEISMGQDGIVSSPQWSGPNGLFLAGFNVSLSQPGIYIVQVTAANGCQPSDTIELVAVNTYPDYEITNDTVSCLLPIGTIGISMPDADIYKWVGFAGPDSSSAFVQVSQPGIYSVIAVDTNAGCSITAIARVIGDLDPPAFSYSAEAISCGDPVATLSFLPVSGNEYTDIHWLYPDMTIINSLEVSVSNPGDYLLSATGKNGCIGSTLVPVVADTLPPIFFLEADTMDCDRMVIIRNIKVDSLAAISWWGPGMFSSNQFNPMVTNPGLYIANGIGSNGCISSASVSIESDFELPEIALTLDSLNCFSPFAFFVVTSPDSVISYEWRDSLDNIVDTDSRLNAAFPGLYTIQIEGENHCKTVDSIWLKPREYPVINLDSDTFTCDVLTMTLTASSDVLNPVFSWMNANGDELSTNAQLGIDYSGPFIISVTGLNGCETRDTIFIPVDTVSPKAIIQLDGELRCTSRDIKFDGSSSSPLGLNFFWTTTGGLIKGNNISPVVEARDTGLYILKVTKPDNGCSDFDTFHLTEHPDAISLAFLDVKQAACSGDSNASIEIIGLQGGIQPLLYQFEGGIQQTENLFEGLKPGNYLIQILDAAGCLFDTIVTIDPTSPYTVNAGPDKEIFIGESIMLSGTTDLPVDLIINQEWDSLGFVFCQDCPDFTVSPHKTAVYRYRVTSETGCMIDDEVTVFVIEKGKYFIGNVFTPNGDNINDEIRVHTSPGIVRVLKWIIFDRWGNAVFGRTDFNPNDPSVFWDGRTPQGEELNPAVYPFLFEVELLNGAIEIHHGDITLLR